MNALNSLWRRGAAACLLALNLSAADPFPEVYNTEPAGKEPMSPAEALDKFVVPPGFSATLFAHEPDIRQPIAMTFDARGRLWVAENYTYAENPKGFERALRDRIVILEDTNGDGKADERKIFWDQAQLLSSVEIGFGGVFALCPPQLLFIPDRNGDDVPDGEPEVLLDGWNSTGIRHNIANGLKWGPDGWLYGRHGILANSEVGRPGSPKEARVRLNCSIWRYHPVRKTFEAIAHGTTNPWGMDWNAVGEPFFINTVIGHLWHVIPGAHYRRMYGEDLDPHVYELIEQHADHVHWDTKEEWSDVRKLGVTASSSKAGGGHAHSGLMIYQGGNWPEAFQGRAFTVNFHGRRLNQDRLERAGSGYVGRHEPDQFTSGDPWFRGLELLYGPEGAVYIADWSDTGECHDDSGIHRSSGRIYRIVYGKPRNPSGLNLAKLGQSELVELQLHENEWHARQSRLILQQHAATGARPEIAQKELERIFLGEREPSRRLRALWSLFAIGAFDDSLQQKCLADSNEHVRAWGIRLITDAYPLGNSTLELPANSLQKLVQLAAADSSPLVRLTLASTLQRLPLRQRGPLARPLLSYEQDAGDHNIPLMLWYGLKEVAEKEPLQAAQLTAESRIPTTRRLVARRLAENLLIQPAAVAFLVKAARNNSEPFASDIVRGFSQALRAWRKAPKPEGWDELVKKFADSAELRDPLRELSAVFGDGRALEQIRDTALNNSAEILTRRTALQTLIEQQAPDLRLICEKLLDVRDLAGMAARGLALFDDPAVARLLVRKYGGIYSHHRPEVIATLVSRPAFARVLLENVGVGENKIPRHHITAYHARQIGTFRDPELQKLLSNVWGEIRETSQERREAIAKYKQLLTPERLKKADARQGRALFNIACAPCHRLYGAGSDIGPDLTGSGRDNLDYLLENMIDPSAVTPADFKMSVVEMRDGRVLNGFVAAQTPQIVTLQTISERLALNRADIAKISPSSLSLMPEGLLQGMTDEQVADLIAYLQSSQQVPLPD